MSASEKKQFPARPLTRINRNVLLIAIHRIKSAWTPTQGRLEQRQSQRFLQSLQIVLVDAWGHLRRVLLFSGSVQTGSDAQPASRTMSYCVFLGVKLPGLCMERSIPLSCFDVCLACYGTAFYFTVSFGFDFFFVSFYFCTTQSRPGCLHVPTQNFGYGFYKTWCLGSTLSAVEIN